MDEDQIWAQLDLRAKNICDTLDLVLEGGPDEDENDNFGDSDEDSEEEEMNGLDADFGAIGSNMEIDDELLDEDSSVHGSNEDTEEEGSISENSEDLDEGVMDLRDSSSDEGNSEDGRLKPTWCCPETNHQKA